MERALQMQSRLSTARRSKSRGKSALMFSVSAEPKTAWPRASWSSFSKKNWLANSIIASNKRASLAPRCGFLPRPGVGLLTDGVWLKNAKHSNNLGQMLAERLRTEAKIDIVFPVEANAVFLRMNEHLVRELHGRGWHFYKFIEPDIYRVMCSWSATDRDIADFVAEVVALKGLKG